MEFQNKTSWELEGRGYAYNEFWIPKRPQKKPQNTNSLGLQKGGLNHHGFLDFIKNTKKSRNETVDRELEGKAWRSLGTNVLYSIHCTVQYHDGAFKGNRVDFSAVDNDIGRSLMIDVFNTEIHGNNCTRAKVTPDQKYCSNRQDKDQFTTREDKADVSPVVIRTNIDGSRIVDKLRAKDENQFTTREDKADFSPVVIRTNMGGSLIVNELKARVNEIDCMGPHLAPTCTEDEADFLTVVSRANIDGSKIEVRLVDIDIMENMIVDELRTEIYEIDYMGPHLAPTCTGPERDYSDIPNGSQEVAIAEGHSFHVGPNVDREVDTDGDRTVSVLQWLQWQYQANRITSSSVYFVVQEIEEESAPKSGQN